ncbi:hypothetical protein PR003_g26701 [Phytophthora rubi]|uniref:Cysteine-rich protein n=1 Tax=Phytophthora rubi TaxID=129364 RepID=A0A6A4C480_9STRA|nr:hypothetical protein PR002_g25513 [Phytophthora rubi]KAE8976869.1 hypothetical protein PR001_g25288 [Phytophthora rubi]KAE9285017.1 hypothetical protein PR003_g26701 [Phytophthora rubi]
MLMKFTAAFVVLAVAVSTKVNAGPLAFGICQAGCNAAAVACYSSAGVLFLPAAFGCAALSTCMAVCAAAGMAPTP